MASLRFRRSDGSQADAEDVLQTLRREGSSISEICVEEIAIRDEDVKEMEQLLIQYHKAIHLSSLELPSNGLTMAAGKPLASIVTAQYETLLKLDLSNNPLTSVGLGELIEPLTAKSLSPSRIQYLNLTACQLGPRSAPMLASLIRNNRSIQTLLLSNNALGTKTIKAMEPVLSTNSTLQTLDISYNAIKPRGAKLLAQALLSSQNNNRSSLQKLDVTCNKLAPQGIQALCEMLVVNRTIQTLLLGSNNMEGEGAAYLANVLHFNYTLKELDLESNQIGPDGASLLIDQLRDKNRTLETLNLAWNG
ncbi:MAG: hypothetical protein SGARI_006695, partial [Bacillariaceae sp.]